MKAVLLITGVFIAGAAAILVPAPVTIEARVLQHLLSIGIQAAAAVLAAIFAWRASIPYWEGSREGLVWKRTSAAAALWAAALVAQAINDWVGRGPSYPSAADVFFLASAGVLTATLLIELDRARWLFPRRYRMFFYGSTVLLWAVVMGLLLWPTAMLPPHTVGEGVNVLYATMAVLLFALAVNQVVTFRVGRIGSGWSGMAAGVALLAVGMLGVVYLTWFEVYSQVHPINVMRIAGLCLLGASAAWHGDAWHSKISSVRTPSLRRPRQSIWSAISARIRNGDRHGVPRIPFTISQSSSRERSTAGEWETSETLVVPSTLSDPTVDVAPSAGLSLPTNGPATIAEHSTTAQQLMAAGRLREAQEAYLNVLLLYGTDKNPGALRGLIAARRRAALDDPVVLHQQADAYQHAATSGFETEERYAPQAMQLLAKASLLAAEEIESERRLQSLTRRTT